MNKNIIKLFRFASIYGINRTINKTLGRLRTPFFKAIYFFQYPPKKNISIIGCGQFAFSCIAFFLKKNKGKVFLGCYDIDDSNAESMSNYYSFQTTHKNLKDLINEPNLEIVYIASNHNTHTQYAVEAMQAQKKVYIEKPLSTNYEQFVKLISIKKRNNSTIFVGYNRPYSKAISRIKEYVINKNYQNNDKKAFSINYFISGHLILPNHWYRKPEEGTRVCGNLGHWIDLTIHIFSWRTESVTNININIIYSSNEEKDDNVCVCLSTDLGDIVSIMLSSRSEPFEGINESFNLQYGDVISKVDDFRKLTIWDKHKLIKENYFPKDVGHERAILQPFYEKNRDWKEVEISTLLMLKIKDMVLDGQFHAVFNVKNEYEKFKNEVENEL